MRPILLKELVEELDFAHFSETVLSQECAVSWTAYQKEIYLYRGSSKQDIYTKYDPKSRVRLSRDSNNFSLLFTDTLDSWAEHKIPSRKNSVIFTGCRSSANDYGRVNHIFFEGDPLVAFGTSSDNYNNYRVGFKKAGLYDLGIHGIDALDSTLNTILYYLRTHHKDDFGSFDIDHLKKVQSPEQVDEFVTRVENAVGLIDIDNFAKFIEVLYRISGKWTLNAIKLFRSQGIRDTLATVFDPKINHITVDYLSKCIGTIGKSDEEAWTSGPYYLTPPIEKRTHDAD